VANKQVHIIGNRAFGRRRTVIVSLNPEQPVITFGPRGGGSIRSSTIRGLGADGIRGIAEDGVRPASIQVNLTRILDTRQGISGSFSDLTVKMSIIRNTVINAIELWQVDNLDLLNTLVTNVDEFGLVVFNLVGTGTIHINNCTFLRASLGGIAIVGGAKPVYISNCTIGRCRAAGISLWETGFVRVLSTRVYLTQYGMIWPYDRLADGLIAASSANVLVQDSLFQYNARAGVLYESSGGGIQWTQSEGGRFGLVVQGQPKPTYLGYNNLFVGTEEDILTDGALSVPAAPPLPPQP
jgi:hypothetical protein